MYVYLSCSNECLAGFGNVVLAGRNVFFRSIFFPRRSENDVAFDLIVRRQSRRLCKTNDGRSDVAEYVALARLLCGSATNWYIQD